MGCESVKQNNYQWKIPPVETVDENFKNEMEKAGYTENFITLLWQRNIHTMAAFEELKNTDISDLHDPFLLHDMDKAVERIQTAIMEGEPILIYGDYDADGITSTSILKEALETLGAEVGFVLPNRFIHGYGPNKELFAEKIDEGFSLIITVDNGVAGNEAIAYANQQNIDVIVTDHHELPPELPEAYCIIHPRFPGGNYPFGELSGAGVAFKLATALLEEVPVELLDLACVGTIADLVSLTGENRTIVKLGLQVIKQNQRLGLTQLLKVSGVDYQKIDETSIGFSIGPRLNAIGRLGDPNPAVDLMTTFDPDLANELAEKLNLINDERKKIVQDITAEALTMLDETAQVHLLAKENWNPGVLGIVAGNILKQTGKPAIVLAIDDEGNAKGSGRSVDSLDLFAMLNTMREYFTHFGGHAAAIGLTMPVEKIPALQAEMNQYISNNQIDLSKSNSLLIDEKISISDISLKLTDELKVLAPFGTDNPAPQFMLETGKVSGFRLIGGDHQHVKFSLVDKESEVDVIGFNFGESQEELQQDDLSFVGVLEINEWNGQKKVQFRLIDFKSEGLQIIDRRAKHTWQQKIDGDKLLYLAFQPKTKKVFQPIFGDQIITFDQALPAEIDSYQQLVVLDCPDELAILKQIVHLGNFQKVYLYLYSRDQAYINGMPDRQQFKDLYKFIIKQQKLDVRYKLKNISNYLRIPENLLVFMIHVFSELKFVTIDNGVLEAVSQPENRSFEESQAYQKRLGQINSEKFLLLEDIQSIRNWLQN
nr:single-stranded-DNA-specific exonuclease RecJ [Enterococcus alishanensis]